VRWPAHRRAAGDGLKRLLAAAAALIIVVVAVVLALAGTLDDHGTHDPGTIRAHGARTAARSNPKTVTSTSRTNAAEPAAATGTAPPPVLTPVSARPQTPAAHKLETALAKWLRAAGPRSGVLVFDLSNETELFGAHPGYGRPPASVEKLWTTTAILNRLGADFQLDTTVLGTGHLSHGVWHGNLYLHGGGDPTFGDSGFNHVWNDGYGPTPNELIAQLRRHGIHSVTGRVFGDESLFDHRRGALITDYKPDTPDLGGQLSALSYDHGTVMPHYDPATFAAHQFVQTMRALGLQAIAGGHDGTAPLDARVLATVASPPMSVMLRLMNVPSDDLFAELFTKQLGVQFGDGGTITSGARVISQTIASRYGLDPTILDGSGLGRQDRTSPEQIVQLLTALWHTRLGDQLTATLPTVGVNGTVQSIGLKTAAARHCIAKTGSLDDVTNLAGYCSARGGQQLAFAFFVDGPENSTGFWLESKMLAAIARY
jgi:D-alanyl-D-alanine carboxypeptidase/D-alanyl-D-alanine-endopeptidase (penicillin-binding protein 4)